MDEIKAVLPKSPFRGNVIHLKHTVRRHPSRLNRREVRANDLSIRELFRHLYRPDPSPRAHVQDPIGVLDWRFVELVVEGEFPGVVGDVLLVVVDFVIGAPIGAVAVGVVAAAVFVAVARAGGFEGVGYAFVDGGGVIVGGVGVIGG